MLLDDGEQFQCHAARLLSSRFPLLNGRFAGVKEAGEYWLANAKTLPQFLDLCRLQYRWRRETGGVEPPHRGFVNRSDLVHSGSRRVDCLKSVALELTFARHVRTASSAESSTTPIVAPGATVPEWTEPYGSGGKETAPYLP